MTKKDNSNRPPEEYQFKFGKSGNPNGRPPKKQNVVQTDNPLAAITSKTFASRRNGVECEMTTREVIQTKTFNEAMKGNLKAIRQIFKWIRKRREYTAQKTNRRASVGMRVIIETANPRDADAALKLLGIITLGERMEDQIDGGLPISDHESDRLSKKDEFHVLQPWVVEVALKRRRSKARLSKFDLDWLLSYTRDGTSVTLPRGYKHDK